MPLSKAFDTFLAFDELLDEIASQTTVDAATSLNAIRQNRGVQLRPTPVVANTRREEVSLLRRGRLFSQCIGVPAVAAKNGRAIFWNDSNPTNANGPTGSGTPQQNGVNQFVQAIVLFAKFGCAAAAVFDMKVPLTALPGTFQDAENAGIAFSPVCLTTGQNPAGNQNLVSALDTSVAPGGGLGFDSAGGVGLATPGTFRVRLGGPGEIDALAGNCLPFLSVTPATGVEWVCETQNLAFELTLVWAELPI